MTKWQKPTTIIEAFARVLGYSRRGLAKAAERMGVPPDYLRTRNRGAVSVSRVDRLAMTAAMLDLPEFSEEMLDVPEANMEAAKAAAAVIRRALEGKIEVSAPSPDPAAGQPL